MKKTCPTSHWYVHVNRAWVHTGTFPGPDLLVTSCQLTDMYSLKVAVCVCGGGRWLMFISMNGIPVRNLIFSLCNFGETEGDRKNVFF